MTIVSSVNRILVVCLRRLGDVLLTTPLALSIKAAWPQARIEWLVFEGTEGVLQSNPAANAVLTISPDSNALETLRLIRSIFRRYDLAISAQSGDRPSLMAWAAGVRSLTLASQSHGSRLRDFFFSDVVSPVGGHQVRQVLSLLQPLGLPAIPEMSIPKPDYSIVDRLPTRPYVVLHPGAAFSYKRWASQGWSELAKRYLKRDYVVVITGGSSNTESTYLNAVFSGLGVLRLDGKLSWPQLTGLLTRAEYYVGVDTSVTHLASACGCRGTAIFGPTDPKIWGPLPYRGVQRISVVQNFQTCVPCQKEGCNRHVHSHALCLDTLTVDTVWSRINLN